MQKLDRLSKVGIVAIIVVALLGGAGVWWWSRQPLQQAGAKPDASMTVSSAPACEPGTNPCTPEVAAEQAELKKLRAEAEEAQRVVFAERIRLANEGGADEPSEVLLANTSGNYLEMAMGLLRDQKKRGVEIRGSVRVVVKATPGETMSGSDPRLTMTACEDSSPGTYTRDGTTFRGNVFEGKVFAAVVDGRVKLINAEMKQVPSCGG